MRKPFEPSPSHLSLMKYLGLGNPPERVRRWLGLSEETFARYKRECEHGMRLLSDDDDSPPAPPDGRPSPAVGSEAWQEDQIDRLIRSRNLPLTATDIRLELRFSMKDVKRGLEALKKRGLARPIRDSSSRMWVCAKCR